MHLSESGKIVHKQWIKTPGIRPDMNLTLDVFCVMPNHFHAIIEIGENEYNRYNDVFSDYEIYIMYEIYKNAMNGSNDCAHSRDAMHGVSTGSNVSNRYYNRFGPQRKNLASIIRGFKSACTKQIRQTTEPGFYWQERYHDHVIRDNQTYWKIRNYIIHNPENWEDDRFFNT